MLNKNHPSKKFKYCPVCGSNNFKLNTNKSFLCETCKFNYYINSVSSVAVIIQDQEGRLLLMKRERDPFKGLWDLPGGFVDVGERAEETVIREVKEETNLDVIEIKYLYSEPNEYVFSDLTIFTLDLVFKVKVNNTNNIKSNDIEESNEIQFFEPQKIDVDMIGLKSIKNIVKKIITNRDEF